ncbi:transposase [Leptospira santarosai]|uniref:Transposase n=1 Tax=Leptospira santarosai TaxID=28183 RepID=A0AB73LKI5_9LEPT|nr:transposase [Leptospira santarosai]
MYKNHRQINHSAHSKDVRYRWARNRWSKNGVHNQVAEGNQRLLKTAFSSYCYIRPENSTRYLNEFSFLKNAHVFGLDVICENAYQEYVSKSESRSVDEHARVSRNARCDVGDAGQRGGVRWGSFQGKTGGPSGPAVGFFLKG